MKQYHIVERKVPENAIIDPTNLAAVAAKYRTMDQTKYALVCTETDDANAIVTQTEVKLREASARETAGLTEPTGVQQPSTATIDQTTTQG